MSHPHGVGGLKCVLIAVALIVVLVPPPRGGWIEMTYSLLFGPILSRPTPTGWVD